MSAQRAMQDFANSASTYAGTEQEISDFIDQKKSQLQTKFRGAVQDKISATMFGNEISQEQKERLEEVSGMAIPLAMGSASLFKKVRSIRAAKAARAAKTAEGSNGSGAAGGDSATVDEAGGAAGDSSIATAGGSGGAASSATATGTSQSAAASTDEAASSVARAESGGGFEQYGGSASRAVPGVSRVGSINAGDDLITSPDELSASISKGSLQGSGRLLRSGERLGWNQRANYRQRITFENTPTEAAGGSASQGARAASNIDAGVEEGVASLATRARSAVQSAYSASSRALGSARSSLSGARATVTAGMDDAEQQLVSKASALSNKASSVVEDGTAAATEEAGAAAETVGALDVLGPVGLAAGIGFTLYDVFSHRSDKNPPPTPATPVGVNNPFTTSSFSTGNLVLPSKSAVLDQAGGHAAF